MSMNFGLNMFSQPYTSNVGVNSGTSGSSTTEADLKEYKSLLEKQSKGMLSTRDQSRLKELQTSLSKTGKLNHDGSIKSGRNSDRLKANARRMSWEEVGSIWSCGKTSAARIVQNTASRAMSQQNRISSGMMSKNGSIFGRR